MRARARMGGRRLRAGAQSAPARGTQAGGAHVRAYGQDGYAALDAKSASAECSNFRFALLERSHFFLLEEDIEDATLVDECCGVLSCA